MIAADVAAAILRDVRSLVGATTPTVRSVRRRYSRLLAGQSPDVVLAIVQVLLADKTWTARVVAFELLAGHRTAMSRLNGRLLDELALGLEDWGSIDLFGVTVAGAAWREGRITDAHVMRWARSKNRWRRRLALVSTVPLNSKARGGAGDPIRTLALCHALVADRDDMVVKALSWALRELAKRDAKSVAEFLRREDVRLASRIRREVRAKLETGRKVR
jgi:3-methyladenine DNA glycosylase AlkD